MRTSHTRALVSATIAILLFLSFAVIVNGQGTVPARPDRGLMPGASYSVSDLESVSLTNGNVNVSIPLASLPPIAGGKLKLTLSAIYNSKLWNVTRTQHQLPPIGGCSAWVVNTPN